jgi:hypothetical protein
MSDLTWSSETDWQNASKTGIDIDNNIFQLRSKVVTQPDSGDRTHFDIDGFDSNDFGIVQSSDAIVGDYLWKSKDTNMSSSRYEKLISTSGLKRYPQRGDEFKYYIKEISSSNDNTGIETVFGAQNSYNYYSILVAKGKNIRIKKNDNLKDSKDVGTYSGNWYEVYVTWGDPTIQADVYKVDSSGNRQENIGSVSFDDVEYDTGGVGWVLPVSTGGGILHNWWVIE